MAEFKEEPRKHHSDDTLDPSHHSAMKSLPEAPFSVLGKSLTLKQVRAHTQQGSYMCMLQACSIKRTQMVTWFNMRSEVTGSSNTWSTELHPEITAGSKEKGGVSG